MRFHRTGLICRRVKRLRHRRGILRLRGGSSARARTRGKRAASLLRMTPLGYASIEIVGDDTEYGGLRAGSWRALIRAAADKHRWRPEGRRYENGLWRAMATQSGSAWLRKCREQ